MRLQWGQGTTAVGFEAEEITVTLPGQSEVVPFPIDDLSGGFLPRKQYGDWERDRNRTFENEGCHVHIPGTVLKGYASSVATSLISADFSGYRAANLRAHQVQWPTSSGLRVITGLGPFIVKDTSATDPTPILPATADNVSDNIMAMWRGDVAGTLALFIGTDGATDGVKYTTNPLADSITWTSAVTFAHTDDVVYAGVYLEQFRKHVIWGVINQVAGVYAWKNNASLPMTSSTLEPVCFTKDRNVLGSIPSVTSSELSPTVFGQEGVGDTNPYADGTNGGSAGGAFHSGLWDNLGNAAADDTSNATYGFSAPDTDKSGTAAWSGATNDFISGGYAHSVPKAGRVKGIVAVINCEHANPTSKTATVSFKSARLRVKGASVGDGRSTGQDIGTTDEDVTLGSSSDSWGAELTGADLDYLSVAQSFAISVAANSNDSASGNIGIDQAAALTITYQFPGTQVPIYEGLHGKGSPLLSFPNIVPIIEPVSDDGTGITVKRRLAYHTFASDDEFDRLLCDVSYPYTGLSYVGLMTDHLGGLAVYGGADSSTWDQCVLVGPDASQRDVENLELPATYGDLDTVRVYGAFERQASAALFTGIHHGDNADAQLWLSVGNGRHNAYGVLQSKSGTAIASAPIPYAMMAPTTHAYRFFPNSTSSLHVQYEFVDNDPHADSLLVNATKSRHTGALRVQLPHLGMGKGDSRRTLTAIEVDSFQVDDGTTYGSVAVEYDAGQDLTMASPDVDETFNAAAETFTRRNVVSSGVAFDSGIVALELGTTTGAKTPQALPVTLYMAVSQNNDRIIEARGVKPDMSGWDTLAKLESLQSTKSTQPLMRTGLMDESGGKGGIPTTFDGASVAGTNRTLTLRFREVPGKSAAS